MTKEEAKEIIERVYEGQIKDEFLLETKDAVYTKIDKAFKMAIKTLEQQSIAEKRYQDLVEYFGDKDVAKCVLEDREEFKKWLERVKWHVRKADELARKLEQQPSEDCVSRKAVAEIINRQRFGIHEISMGIIKEKIEALPPVTPTRKEPREDITEDEVKINMLELALNQAKEHAESIEVLTDNHRLIFKVEKRGSENEVD